MSDPLIECVPNFSEGRDPAVLESILAVMSMDDVRLLDYSRDVDHNRSVVTIVGRPAAVVESAVRGAGRIRAISFWFWRSGIARRRHRLPAKSRPE